MHLLADIAYGFVVFVVAAFATAICLIATACIIHAVSDWVRKP